MFDIVVTINHIKINPSIAAINNFIFLLIIYNPNKGDNMKAPFLTSSITSEGLTMQQMKGYKKTSKGKHKQYWQGRIDALAGKPAYKNWLKRISKNL